MNFFETVMGKRFYEGTMPTLNHNLEHIAKTLDKISSRLDGYTCHSVRETEDDERTWIVIVVDTDNSEAIVLQKDRRNRFTLTEAQEVMMTAARQSIRDEGLTEESLSYGDYAAEVTLKGGKDLYHIISIAPPGFTGY